MRILVVDDDGMPGLATVRQAVEAHGGAVSARNAAGGGAVVRIAFGRR